MGQTSLLGLPWPEFANRADGPQAVRALAEQTELKRARYLGRLKTQHADTDFPVAGGAFADVVNETLNLSVNGWIEVDANVTIVGSGLIFAGILQVFVGGVELDRDRYHAQAVTQHLSARVHGVMETNGTKAVQLVIRVVGDGGVQTVNVRTVHYSVRQYGAAV